MQHSAHSPQPSIYEFPDFVARFPIVEMPVTLGEDTHHTFITENPTLLPEMVAQFIGYVENENAEEEFIEFVPCFAIDCDEKYIALVWWKADLLNYEYTLATFTEKGQPIDRKVIAYTRADQQTIRNAVAIIDAELSIHIAEGSNTNGVFDPGESLTRILEILPNGQIVRG